MPLTLSPRLPAGRFPPGRDTRTAANMAGGCGTCGGTGTVTVVIITPSGAPATLTESCPCTYGATR